MTLDQEITAELAALVHEAGLTSAEAARLIVVTPTRRAVVIRPQTEYVMVLTNDALSSYLTGTRWLDLVQALERLEQVPKAHEGTQL